MNNGLSQTGYGDLQKLADIANEREALSRELSAMRAELKNALEANKDLRDRLLARELGGEKDIREAYKLAVERIKRLEDALTNLMGSLGGHTSHWDRTMRHGAGCEQCHREHAAVETARKALEVKP